MSKQKKITVKHYLNTKLKPDDFGYPVYIRVSYGRKNERLKSVWINHTQLSLDDSKQIVDLVNYESEIIKRGIEELHFDEEIKIGSLLFLLLRGFCSGTFIGFDFFDAKEFNKYINAYLKETTKIIGDFCQIHNKEDIDNDAYKSIVSTNAIPKEMQPYVLYYTMVRDFEQLYYKADTSYVTGYLVGCKLTVYDWIYGGAESKFIDYANSLHLVTNEFLINNSKRLRESYINNLKFYSKMSVG